MLVAKLWVMWLGTGLDGFDLARSRCYGSGRYVTRFKLCTRLWISLSA